MAYKNKQKEKEYRLKWIEDNKEKMRLYRKNYILRNKEKIKLYRKDWVLRNRNKQIAHQIIQNLIKTNKIKRMSCEICSDPKTDAHHHDYTKPLEVAWLCRIHHTEEHKRLGTYK